MNSQPERPTFFLDRCLGRGKVAQVLRAAGHSVEIHADHFPETESAPEIDDTHWLREVGKRGWVVLSKDQNIHRNQIELTALLGSGAASFILTSGEMTGPEQGAAFLKAMPFILRMLGKYRPPYVAAVTGAGAVSMLFTHDALIKKLDVPPPRRLPGG